MTAAICCATAPYLAESGCTELVRGNEWLLLDQMLPLVELRCVSLDLHSVTRIDAAGLAALIKLYCAARDAGHSFSVFNPSPRVAQLLALVRLDSILVSNNADASPCHGLQMQESAA